MSIIQIQDIEKKSIHLKDVIDVPIDGDTVRFAAEHIEKIGGVCNIYFVAENIRWWSDMRGVERLLWEIEALMPASLTEKMKTIRHLDSFGYMSERKLSIPTYGNMTGRKNIDAIHETRECYVGPKNGEPDYRQIKDTGVFEGMADRNGRKKLSHADGTPGRYWLDTRVYPVRSETTATFSPDSRWMSVGLGGVLLPEYMENVLGVVPVFCIEKQWDEKADRPLAETPKKNADTVRGVKTGQKDVEINPLKVPDGIDEHIWSVLISFMLGYSLCFLCAGLKEVLTSVGNVLHDPERAGADVCFSDVYSDMEKRMEHGQEYGGTAFMDKMWRVTSSLECFSDKSSAEYAVFGKSSGADMGSVTREDILRIEEMDIDRKAKKFIRSLFDFFSEYREDMTAGYFTAKHLEWAVKDTFDYRTGA